MTQSLHDSKLACYNVAFIHNLVAKSHACNARVPYSSLNGVCVCVVRVEVQIVFFLGTRQACSFEISSRALLCRKFKLASLSIVLRNSRLFNPRLVSPKYLRYIFVSLCSDNSLHLNPCHAIPKLQHARKLPPPVKS